VEPPGIEPAKPSQSRAITSGREPVEPSTGAEVRGPSSTDEACAISACELPAGLDALSDAELRAAAMALVRCESYRVAMALLAELVRRGAAEASAKVVRLDPKRRDAE
jgi:hypothetical protein